MTLTSFVTLVTLEDTSPLLERGRQEVRYRLRHGTDARAQSRARLTEARWSTLSPK